MSKQISPLLVILSVALNLAFIGVWVVSAMTAHTDSPEIPCQPGQSDTIWCPLHRQLNVTDQQWRQIEPRLREFRTKADAICQKTGQLRIEIVDLLAASETDVSAVKTKQEEILAGQQKMQALVIEQLMGEKAVLTAEQRQRLFEMLRSRSGCGRGGPLLVPGRGHEGGIGQTLRTGGGD